MNKQTSSKDGKKKVCESCKWFLYRSFFSSKCRRHPPAPGNGWGGGGFPTVSSDDFCGEWEVL